MATVYIGIGSNIGDRERNFEEALRKLVSIVNLKISDRSRWYSSKPAGGPPQEDYLNGVLRIETDMSPESFLSELKKIENDMGRMPSGRNHPRVIDLDILLYNDRIVRTKELTVPHPKMHERSFVLKGLAELAPDLMHPVTGKTVGELYRTVR
jgi:2-amino-4-hydroxy-6-hydroxymethyldihydropteridine diphosphokinase